VSNLDKPTSLNEKGNLAYNIILNFLKKNDMTYTGGCRSFYSPQEWKSRGERYGDNSHLIVVYDGGDLSYIFNGSYCSSKYQEMQLELRKANLYFEECTCWYSAIYSI
jgi:hypothetical protein